MLKRSILFVVLLYCLDLVGTGQTPNSIPHGTFNGELILRPLDDGRDMQVMQDFSYTDWQGHKLIATAGFVSDGATIPRAVWSLVGGPWDGPYRKAAVVHDVGCRNHKYTWRDTHRLFLEAMLDSGVTRSLALTMYWGVLVGGPRWDAVATTEAKSRNALQTNIASELNKLSTTERNNAIVSSTTTEQKVDSKTVKTYSATVYVPSAGKVISPDTLKKLQAELETREQKGETISIDEIENRASRQ